MIITDYTPVLRLPTNIAGKDYIVGDLHGMYDQFMTVLERIGFNREFDRMFSVGDLVDRGPKNIECLELLTENWFYAVRGNHEQMMIDAGKSKADENPYTAVPGDLWFINGGNWSFNEDKPTIDFWRKITNKLPIVIVVGEGATRFNIVHAEFNECTDAEIDDGSIVEKSSHQGWDDQLLWGRNMAVYGKEHLAKPQYVDYQEGLSLTYVGHTPLRKLLRIHQQVYLDGGAVFQAINKCVECRMNVACHQDELVYQWDALKEEMTVTRLADIEHIFPRINIATGE